MAVPQDYLSKPFGSFVLDTLVGSGATAEVYRCVHVPTGLFYALRLGVDDDRLWDGPPLLPPPNGATERQTVEVCWGVTGDAWAHGRQPVLVHVFRMLDSRDVVPLSAPVRVRDALTIAAARALRSPAVGTEDAFSLYEEAVSMMYADAAFGDASLPEWRAKWLPLSGGSRLLAAVEPLIEAGELAPALRRTAWERSMRAKLGAAEGALELAENVLVKLAYARATDAIDWRTFGATLRCPFFRLNVHRAEVEQLLRLHHLFARSEEQHYLSEMLELAREWLALTLGSLAVPSFDPGSDPDEFERCEDAPPDVEDDWVVLQEFALTNPSLFDAVRLLVHGTTS